jgi:hypothetical protein
LDDYIAKDIPVRVIGVFVDEPDLNGPHGSVVAVEIDPALVPAQCCW